MDPADRKALRRKLREKKEARSAFGHFVSDFWKTYVQTMSGVV